MNILVRRSAHILLVFLIVLGFAVAPHSVFATVLLPDLIPESLTHTSGIPIQGNGITFIGWAKNQGTALADPYHVNFSYRWAPTDSWTNFPHNSKSALDPGYSAPQADAQSIILTQSGTLTMQYCVDSLLEISEGVSGESNNCRTLDIAVAPAICSDGFDNDDDGKFDYPADPGCADEYDDNENDLPDLLVTSNNPAANTSFTTAQTITFTGTVQNSFAAPVTQGGWGDIEIDWGSDNSFSNYNAFGGLQLGSFSTNQSKTLTFATSSVATGTHRYRFNADVTNTLPESNDDNRSGWRSFTVTSAPNLESQNLTLSAGPYTVGTPITFSAKVSNNSTGGTGIGFTDNFTYQWNGTGGTWNNFTGNTVAKTALDAGSLSADGPVSFTPGQDGTLYIQHCVDSALQIDEGANETPNCTVSAGVVVASPSISVFEVCTGSSPCTSFGGTHTVATGTPLTINWTASADTCEEIMGSGFDTGAAFPTSGSDAILAPSVASTSEQYMIGCKYGTGVPAVRTLTVTTLQAIPTLVSTQTTVREGNTVRLDWDTNNGAETSCTLTGGNINGGATLGNGTGSNETGYGDLTINGRTTFVLTCGSLSAVKTVEIIPTGWEG